MAKKKATSMDVAREAGVSQATVSMILNKKYNVSFSKETIRQVTEAAEKLDYHLPKQRIRRSAKSRKLLVVFCPTLTNPYYVMLLQGIEAMAKEYGYGVFVCNTQRDLKIEENYLRMMREVQPLGIIYACNPSFSRQVAELSGEIPVVVISNRDDEFSIDAVALNNQKPGILMARHLLELGHRDVAFIAPPLTARQHQRQKRVGGFLMEFEKAGLSDHVLVRSAADSKDTEIPNIESEYRMGYDLTVELLREGQPVTAIAALNDMMAFGAMDAMKAAGISYGVDGDVILISFDACTAGLEYVMSGDINADFECNPLAAPFVEDVIKQLESGSTPDKEVYMVEHWYVNEDILSSITVNGEEQELTVVTQEIVDAQY